jgi:hypothetical protein
VLMAAARAEHRGERTVRASHRPDARDGMRGRSWCRMLDKRFPAAVGTATNDKPT